MIGRRLTVVQTLPALEAGGVERGTVEVAGALVERGHRAVVVSAGGRMTAELDALGAEHVTLPVHAKSPMTLRAVRPLRTLLRDLDADILHARSRVPAWVSYLAWRGMPRGARPHFVTSVHGLYSVNRWSAIMTRGEVVEAVSCAARDYILANYPRVPESRIRVIHRGVDPADFPHGFTPSGEWLERWRREFPAIEGRRLITMIGRITRLKGHAEFVGLVARLRDAGTPIHGVIVGGEDPRRAGYARELRELIRSKQLEHHITFTGHRDDAREIAAISDVVLSLSTTPESFGRSVLEALRLGTPVLGWDHGGVGEVLAAVHPDGAILPGDTAELARRAVDLLAQPKTLVPPTAHFTKREMLDRTIALYEELAAEVPAPT